jgi:hypothetical protein
MRTLNSQTLSGPIPAAMPPAAPPWLPAALDLPCRLQVQVNHTYTMVYERKNFAAQV